MEKIRNLSVRKTILLYLAAGLICSFFLSAVIVKAATYTQEQIWWNYVDPDKYFEAVNGEGRGKTYYRAEIPRPSSSDMSSADRNISEFCDFLQTYTTLILSAAASCASVFLFYKHKLKQPLEELEQASKRIAGNGLDFHGKAKVQLSHVLQTTMLQLKKIQTIEERCFLGYTANIKKEYFVRDR